MPRKLLLNNLTTINNELTVHANILYIFIYVYKEQLPVGVGSRRNSSRTVILHTYGI